MSHQKLGGIPKIRGNLTPQPGWKLTGEIDKPTGMPVYYEEVPVFEKRIRLDPQGKEIWHRNKSTNFPERPATELVQVGVEKREFIQVDLGNGIVQKNYDFKGEPVTPSASEVDVLKQQVSELRELVSRLTDDKAEDEDEELSALK